jgi:hypothetical protein
MQVTDFYFLGLIFGLFLGLSTIGVRILIENASKE